MNSADVKDRRRHMRLAQLELRGERQYHCEGRIEDRRCSLQITEFKKIRNPLRRMRTSVKARVGARIRREVAVAATLPEI